MPPPGASAPALAATVEPASTKITSDLPPARLIYKRVLGDGLLLASILDFRPRLANRCKVLPVYAILRASILDFKPKLANRCRVLPVYTLFRASILDFKPRLGSRCSVIAAAVRNGPPATAVVAAIFRVRFYSSLPQRRMARLLGA